MHRNRHPLARALSLVLGLAVVGVLLVFGLVVAGVLLVGGGVLLALRAWKQRNALGQPAPRTSHRPEVLEGDFVVIHQGRHVTH
jgi:membrane protein implicated in regulation of membrane protease activity